ncbi:MAG TPA: hypothetical protein VGG53_11915 [Mycobacterium sp.]|uniref:hypothetical protein n=1 Tax=Mycobacterium sp. TaxID=1785 RepID=UPI002F3E3105
MEVAGVSGCTFGLWLLDVGGVAVPGVGACDCVLVGPLGDCALVAGDAVCVPLEHAATASAIGIAPTTGRIVRAALDLTELCRPDTTNITPNT